METEEEREATVLERDVPLSESVLWRMQRRFFRERGVGAWSDNTVPHYVTANPFIAGAYARVVLGFLRDCAAPPGPPPVLHVVELGAGAGRFAHHFLRALAPALELPALRGARVRYVMTDFAPATLDFWRAHPGLAPWVERGLLDFALFDAESPAELRLDRAGETLAPGEAGGPVVVVANYVFDGVTQDSFTIEEGRLFENRFTVLTSLAGADPDDPAHLDHLELTYEPFPTGPSHYGDPGLDAVLEHYLGRLSGTTLGFPSAALRCVEHFLRASDGRLLVLTADRGTTREEDLLGAPEPELTVHGSFSIPVNHHALAQHARCRGGEALCTSHRSSSIDVVALLPGGPVGAYPETRLAYGEAVERGGPDDFFAQKKGVERLYGELTVPQLLGHLRLSGWDPNVFAGCLPAVLARLGTADEPLRQELARAALRVWEGYFPIGERADLAFATGELLCELGEFAGAAPLFEESLRLYGPDAATFHNLAVCRQETGDRAGALECVRRALEVDPAFDAAREMRIRLGP